MEQVSLKYTNLVNACAAFIKSIEYYQQLEKMPASTVFASLSHEELLDSARRSLIQAFEVMIDVFWKHLKWLLDEHFQITIGIINPRNVITKACEIRLLTEPDAKLLLELVDCRNKTSHIYKQELAEMITHKLLESWQQIERLVIHCNPQTL